MEVRKIKPIESYDMQKTFSISFEEPENIKDTAQEHLDALLNDPGSYGGIHFDNGYGAFENGSMIACLWTTPFNVMFDGKEFGMTGIGGVGSLPHCRKNGSIRSMFEPALVEMYEKGHAFSYLYPFSTYFYRKFGYEVSAVLKEYTVEIASVKQKQTKGFVRLVTNDEQKLDVQKVYAEYIKKMNMSVVRNSDLWKYKQKKDPVKDGEYTYVWYNENGEPKSYLTYKTAKWDDEGRNMKFSSFCFTDYEGFYGLMGFLDNFESVYTHFTISVPSKMEIQHFFPEITKVKSRLHNYGMARVVNVKTVLENAKYKGEGEFNILVRDKFIEQNNGTWKVKFCKSGADVTKTDSAPDIETDINIFTQIITGVLDFEESHMNPFIKINSNADVLAKAFYSKYIWINDYF